MFIREFAEDGLTSGRLQWDLGFREIEVCVFHESRWSSGGLILDERSLLHANGAQSLLTLAARERSYWTRNQLVLSCSGSSIKFFHTFLSGWGKYTGGTVAFTYIWKQKMNIVLSYQKFICWKKYRNKAKIQEKKDVHGMKFRISTNKNIKHAGKTCVIFLLHHVKKSPENGI